MATRDHRNKIHKQTCKNQRHESPRVGVDVRFERNFDVERFAPVEP
ncbi:MAG: hypothetical protein IPP66_00130 [Anaerolineales bacterium]|nr:hypothetical protein [Anaerolineales bacterium]